LNSFRTQYRTPIHSACQNVFESIGPNRCKILFGIDLRGLQVFLRGLAGTIQLLSVSEVARRLRTAGSAHAFSQRPWSEPPAHPRDCTHCSVKDSNCIANDRDLHNHGLVKMLPTLTSTIAPAQLNRSGLGEGLRKENAISGTVLIAYSLKTYSLCIRWDATKSSLLPASALIPSRFLLPAV